MNNSKKIISTLKLGCIGTSIITSSFPIYGQTNIKESEKTPYNILFISVDDLRPDIGCYGNTDIITPNIDRLASMGIVFNRAYCQQAVSNPSRASLLTGLRPQSTGVRDLKSNFRDYVPDVITLPQHFKNNGYYTENIGKIFHNIIQDSISWDKMILLDGYPFDPDAVYRLPENVDLVNKKIESIRATGDTSRYVDQLGEWYIKTVSYEITDVGDDDYFDGAQTAYTVKRLAELKEMNQPFFFGLGYYHPHLPFNVPRKYWDMYNRDSIPMAENRFLPKDAPFYAMDFAQELRTSYMDFKGTPSPHEGGFNEEQSRILKHGYYASVSYIDVLLGRVLNALDSLDLMDNTIIVLWGDHGWKLGEHNGWTKQTNYEIDTRSSLIVYMPNNKLKGIKTDALVEFVDIYPTLCEMTGLEIPSFVEGSSMLPLLESPNQEWKSAAFSEFVIGVYRERADGKKWEGLAMRTDRYRYVEWYDMATNELTDIELYDHQTDPQENQNIANRPENSEIIKQLSAKLKAGWKEAKPPIYKK